MKISYNWLQTYFDTTLPSHEEVVNKLTFHAFEIEGTEVVGEDVVFDVDVLPNRAHDCLSHRGIAKEVSVLFDMPLSRDVFREEEKALSQSKELSIEIEDPLLCKRYSGALIKGVEVKESPQWLKERLEAIGQKSINNIVDVTNYVMFSLGQPLHTFDAGKLEKKDDTYTIKVRNAKKGEKITVLTGEEYELTETNLLITDGNNDVPIGIAGIKGGKTAEVDKETTDIIIESANFHPIHTRKTSQVLKLRTDASTRFENELAPETTYYGLTEVVALITELAGGQVEGFVDVFPKKRSIVYKIGISAEEVNKLLGTDVVGKDIENILTRFGYSYKKVNTIDTVLELGPTFENISYKYGASISYDAPRAFDCSSFIGYLFSQGGVSIPRMVIDQFIYSKEITEEELKPGDLIFSRSDPSTRERLDFKLVADGTVHSHFGPQEQSQEFLSGTEVTGGVSHNGIYLGDGEIVHASQNGVVIENYKQSKYFKDIVGYRRVADNTERFVVEIPFERLDLHAHTSFLTSGNKEDVIEEIGRVYGYENIEAMMPQKLDTEVLVNKNFYYQEKTREILSKEGFIEVYTYSLRDMGEVELENPLSSDKSHLRVNLSDGVSESVELNKKNALVLGLEDVNVFEIGKVFTKNDDEHTSLCIASSNPQKTTEVVEHLSKEIGTGLNGKETKGVFECNLSEVTAKLPEQSKYDVVTDTVTSQYQPFSLYPFALRDIAVWVPEEVAEESVRSIIQENAGELLVQISLFDEYKKDDRVSYAFKLVFQSQGKTLSDDEVNGVMDKVTEVLNSEAEFEVR